MDLINDKCVREQDKSLLTPSSYPAQVLHYHEFSSSEDRQDKKESIDASTEPLQPGFFVLPSGPVLTITTPVGDLQRHSNFLFSTAIHTYLRSRPRDENLNLCH
ncbi:hypothetical protein SK128_013232 [Halocaridina rubra]|uniref:Uncharacterized protein n=1 Tax=Halocaridina rubra TaxID=373956 RepID=A0AAN9A1K0_HALRR